MKIIVIFLVMLFIMTADRTMPIILRALQRGFDRIKEARRDS